MQKTSFKHVTVRIPRALDRWLRIQAAERDLSKSDLIRTILSRAADLPQAAREQEVQDNA